MRSLSDSFMHDLTDHDGSLFPILTRVQNDQTLMPAIRDGYINLYYRGGNLVRVSEKHTGTYEATFDENYNIAGAVLSQCPQFIQNQQDTMQWVKSFSQRKEWMNTYFAIHEKPEREFQQVVVRENNVSTVSNAGEYFIVDIEAVYAKLSARFDMLAIRWPAGSRNSVAHCRPALIEMKYGDEALDGTSGILKHLQDMESLIANRSHYETLLESMSVQFEQLYELELFKFNRSKNSRPMKLAVGLKPEVIFLFANHNPRSMKLKNILASPECSAYQYSELFDLRFFVSSFAGYTMHSRNMKTLNEIIEML